MYSNFPGRPPCVLNMHHMCIQSTTSWNSSCCNLVFHSQDMRGQYYITSPCWDLFPVSHPDKVRPTTILSAVSNCFHRGLLANLHHDFSSTFWVYGLYWLAAVQFCSVIINWCGQKLEASQLSTGTLGCAFSRKCLHRSWFQDNGEGQDKIFMDFTETNIICHAPLY